MNSNPKNEASRGRETNKQRRRLLKLAALGGASAIAAPGTFQ
jgi:hypothetical protein